MKRAQSIFFGQFIAVPKFAASNKTNMAALGITVILAYILLGFWLLIFLSLWIPLMATLLFMEKYSPEAGAKLAAIIAPRE
jgi:hypothetical protein